ncbi:MAG: hypothetical protein IH624_03880 [Phycisphaerae bacterium]|nr:hypothetical protein [Phycisphaerae bacterium]
MSDAEDLLYVQDFVTVKQEVTGVSVKFDDQAVSDYMEDQVDRGRKPEQLMRIWCHTHPGFSPEPSWVDEETFGRVFGSCQWALMFILSADGQTYARLSFNVGPRGCILIPVRVDYSREFDGSDWKAWDAEYEANVRPAVRMERLAIREDEHPQRRSEHFGLSYDFLDELEQMDVQERQLVLDELADRQDLWDEESEVMFI